MAERLNAHDSKSCYAGMYTRVQIPLSAPTRRFYAKFLHKTFNKIWVKLCYIRFKTII